MKKIIHKYPLNIRREANRVAVMMPMGARVLSVQLQGDVPTIWAEHNAYQADFQEVERVFSPVLTGEHVDHDGFEYIGTTVIQGPRSFVQHWFEVTR